jgi:dipeptidyl aminopeptidase/acylaminoacyl peptidase
MRNRLGRLKHLLLLLVLYVCFVQKPASSLQAQSPSPYVAIPKWSIDGSKVAYVNGLNVEVRDAQTAQLIFTLIGHEDFIFSVNWSPDGSRIATASFDETVKVWDAANGQLLLDLQGHNDRVSMVVWFPDSSRLLSFGVESNPSLFVWDAQTGNTMLTVETGTVIDASFSPDGARLAVSVFSEVVIYETTRFELQSSSPRRDCCANQMYRLVWSPDGTQIATGSNDSLVTVWDAVSLMVLAQFAVNPYAQPDSRDVPDLSLSWVRDLYWSNDNSLLTVSGDGTITRWNPQTGQALESIQIAPLAGAAWSPMGGRLAILGGEANAINQSAAALSQVEGFEVAVPFASPARLQAIAAACNAPRSITRTLPTQANTASIQRFEEALLALPDGALPPGCEADLQAVAAAMGG